jgi:hypothetical protein
MKTKVFLFAIAIAFAATSCMQNPEGEKVRSGEATEVGFPKDAQILKADLSASKIEWLGTKPTGTHYGTLAIQDGKLYVKDGKLLGGEFIMNMKEIVVLDIEDPKMNQNLTGHLKSADFFLVDSFPTAKFQFNTTIPIEDATNTEGEPTPNYRLEGNLTLRGVTRQVNFPANIKISNEGVTAKTPQFVLNRTEWNVNYGSKSIFAELKDNFIHDEMGIKITLIAQ